MGRLGSRQITGQRAKHTVMLPGWQDTRLRALARHYKLTLSAVAEHALEHGLDNVETVLHAAAQERERRETWRPGQIVASVAGAVVEGVAEGVVDQLRPPTQGDDDER